MIEKSDLQNRMIHRAERAATRPAHRVFHFEVSPEETTTDARARWAALDAEVRAYLDGREVAS